jgi:hypothetical protein
VVVGRAANLAMRGFAARVSLVSSSAEVAPTVEPVCSRGIRRAIWPLGKLPFARPPGWIRRFWRFVICLRAVSERTRRVGGFDEAITRSEKTSGVVLDI